MWGVARAAIESAAATGDWSTRYEAHWGKHTEHGTQYEMLLRWIAYVQPTPTGWLGNQSIIGERGGQLAVLMVEGSAYTELPNPSIHV